MATLIAIQKYNPRAIIKLVILIIFMIINFYRKDKVAGLLQVPYLLWVLFASFLNLSIYFLNK